MAARRGGANYDEMMRVGGLADLRRVLRKVDRRLDRDVSAHLRAMAKRVRERARRYAPTLTGALSRSLRYSVTRKRASVYSNAPHSAVHEYGGTVRPKGAPVKIARRYYTGRAIRESRRELDADMLRLLDALGRDWQS